MSDAPPKHILLVASAFPPAAQIGAQRALRFARGLSARGFRVTVLTLQERFLQRVDPGVPSASDSGYRVVRTSIAAPSILAPPIQEEDTGASDRDQASPSPGLRARLRRFVRLLLQRRLLVPDGDVLWLPAALRAARKIHAQTPVDLVMPTMPPSSQILVAGRIAAHTHADLVLDYRDPWAADRRKQHGPVRQWLEYLIERRYLRRARLVLLNTPSALRYYREYYRDLPRSEFLPNGIDAFTERRGALPGPPLTWAYAGTMYGGRRSLAPLLRVMNRLRDEVDLRLILIGSDFQRELAHARELGLEDRIRWLGRLPYTETLEHLRVAHRLVAVVAPQHAFSTPAKIFDYLSTSRPMLILADPRHAVSEVLRDMPEHHVIDPAREDLLEALVRSDSAALTSGGIPDVSRERCRAFEADHQMEILATWLHEL